MITDSPESTSQAQIVQEQITRGLSNLFAESILNKLLSNPQEFLSSQIGKVSPSSNIPVPYPIEEPTSINFWNIGKRAIGCDSSYAPGQTTGPRYVFLVDEISATSLPPMKVVHFLVPDGEGATFPLTGAIMNFTLREIMRGKHNNGGAEPVLSIMLANNLARSDNHLSKVKEEFLQLMNEPSHVGQVLLTPRPLEFYEKMMVLAFQGLGRVRVAESYSQIPAKATECFLQWQSHLKVLEHRERLKTR